MSWKRIGAYEKRQEIGRGTYGTVYLGVHATSRARGAVKKVLGRTATAGANEAALLKRCQGAAHVVQVSILGPVRGAWVRMWVSYVGSECVNSCWTWWSAMARRT